MKTMTTTDKITAVYNDLCQTYSEAVETYGFAVAMTALAYTAGHAVHRSEHSPELRQFGHNTKAMATGMWENAFHPFLNKLRDLCAEAHQRGLN